MKPTLTLLLAACLLFNLSASQAGDADIHQAVAALAGDVKVKKITRTDMKGLMEVVVEGKEGPMVMYADEQGKYLFVGEMLDVKARRNLTQERMDKLTAVKWDSLPLSNAIKVVRGNGKRRLAVFSDPDCPYCRKAEQEFAKLDNVTIYTFAYPLPNHGDAPRKVKLVWCAQDRAQAWLDLMLRNTLPESAASACEAPIEANLALGARLKIDGTPAMILGNGKRIPGYVPAQRLDAMLNEAEGIAP